jgi:hypothetical protein
MNTRKINLMLMVITGFIIFNTNVYSTERVEDENINKEKLKNNQKINKKINQKINEKVLDTGSKVVEVLTPTVTRKLPVNKEDFIGDKYKPQTEKSSFLSYFWRKDTSEEVEKDIDGLYEGNEEYNPFNSGASKKANIKALAQQNLALLKALQGADEYFKEVWDYVDNILVLANSLAKTVALHEGKATSYEDEDNKLN